MLGTYSTKAIPFSLTLTPPTFPCWIRLFSTLTMMVPCRLRSTGKSSASQEVKSNRSNFVYGITRLINVEGAQGTQGRPVCNGEYSIHLRDDRHAQSSCSIAFKPRLGSKARTCVLEIIHFPTHGSSKSQDFLHL